MSPRTISILMFLVLSLLGRPAVGAAQQPPAPSLTEVLDQAAVETKKYVEAFKNLLSEESKTIQTFDKQGDVKKSKSIKSTFLVFQLTKDQNQSTEFRNVLTVDGKPIENADQHSQDFFTKVTKAESSAKELQELRKESSRYDGDLIINGMTLFQSPVLNEKLRPVFDFKLVRKINIEGSDVYEISYRQRTESPFIGVNSKDKGEPGKTSVQYDVDSDIGGDLNGRLRGTLWIDAVTFQVRKEHRELTVQPENSTEPIVAIVNEFEFQNSDFGILTPKRITHLQSRIKGKGAPAQKEMQITMEYANFSKPDVEVKSSEVKSPPTKP